MKKRTDVHSKAIRSYNMSCIRSTGTKPEMIFESILKDIKIKYKKYVKDLPGRPDFVVQNNNVNNDNAENYTRIAIYVNGCFWHRHQNCKYTTMPKTNVIFWNEKFDNNIKRDNKIADELKEMGIQQIIIWECELKHEKDFIKEKMIKIFETS